MNDHSRRPKIIPLAMTVLVSVGLLFLSACKDNGASSKPHDDDYYTCTMHPSVHLHDPNAKCPICGMDLVHIKKGSVQPGTNNMLGGTNAEKQPGTAEEQPTEFTVPVGRQQQIGVTYGVVETRPLQRVIRTVGTVAYDKQRHWDYVARVDGYVQKLDVFSRGEIVEKDASLLTLYSPDLYTAQKEFVNALKMRDDAKGKNSADVLNSAEQLVNSSRERLRLWNITDEQIAELERTRQPQETLALHSPFKGVVQEIGVDQGRHVAVGDHLVDVADLGVVWVWAQFYQDDLPLLKRDLPVTITVPSRPGEQFKGKIAVVDPFINDALRTARVRIDVDNPDFKLRPDMYVDVELSVDMGKGVAVPYDAVLPTGLHHIVFVDKGEGRLEPRYLELGPKYGDFYEVKSGLKEGERVVTSANFLIDAEAKVQGALKEF